MVSSYRINHISLASASSLLSSGFAAAREEDIAVSIAIVDCSGHLVAFGRMDRASIVSIKVAEGKARTAAYIQHSTELFENMINQSETAMLTVPDLVPLKGGVPLSLDGQIIGAVGVSGSSGEKDLRVAQYIASSL